MKRSARRCTVLLTLLFLQSAAAAVVQTPGRIDVDGVLNGSAGTPDVTGDTLDYLKFEVLTTTALTVTSGFGSGVQLMLAQFIGKNDEFAHIGNPFLLLQTSSTEWSSLTRTLDPGVYIAAMGVTDDTSYDIFDGFVPVNPEGGGFIIGPYAYSITGDVRALEFWDGELDGAFRITQLPEPSAATLLGLTAAIPLTRRKRGSPAGS